MTHGLEGPSNNTPFRMHTSPADAPRTFHAGEAPADYSVNPFIVIWEVTRACQLHCLHCRAEAQRHRHPLELTTAEGLHLIDDISEMGRPLLVLTGGDPLERPDLLDFIRHGTARGLEVAMTPSATPRVTREALAGAKAAGLKRCAFSLDGATPQVHDRFRGTRGSFERTIQALEWLRELQIPMQVNTTVTRRNLDDLPHIADLIEPYGPVLWSVFFLVPTGRARAQDMVSADEVEDVLEWLWAEAQRRPYGIKTTEAPHYRRVILQHARQAGATPGAAGTQGEEGSAVSQGAPPGVHAARGRPRRPVNDGNGFVFVSHTGDVYPSGFLPLKTGNVRQTPLADIYRHHPVFKAIRNPDMLKGRCGICEFRHVCGGSRARAYTVTGDCLAEDPACNYQPQVAAMRDPSPSGEGRQDTVNVR